MLLHKEQQSPDGCVLRRFGISKAVPADMDMKTTGASLMGTIAQRNRFCHDLLPRQLRQMVFCRRRMADDLKAVIQTAVMLAVEIFFTAVSDCQNLFRVASDFAALVDLQLNAEKALTGSVEMRLRTIVIVVNDLILQNVIAAFAVGVSGIS